MWQSIIAFSKEAKDVLPFVSVLISLGAFLISAMAKRETRLSIIGMQKDKFHALAEKNTSTANLLIIKADEVIKDYERAKARYPLIDKVICDEQIEIMRDMQSIPQFYLDNDPFKSEIFQKPAGVKASLKQITELYQQAENFEFKLQQSAWTYLLERAQTLLRDLKMEATSKTT